MAGLSLALTACGGALQVRMINSAQKKPSNVWVFFTVDRGKNEPVGGLTADDFIIFEDGGIVSKFESKQVIQNPEVAAVMYTMLLVDMSGSITESGQVDTLVDAAKAFSERVGKTQKVGVYAFDGEEKLHAVVPFTETPGSVQGGLDGLRKYKPKDPSTNLNGAVIAGLRELSTSLDREKKPLKFGTLVLFTDGTDRAARASADDMRRALDDEKYQDYQKLAIGVGAEISKNQLAEVGRDGTDLASERTRVKEAFDKIADKIEAHSKRFYLLSYCTPARRGQHEVRIEVHAKNPDGMASIGYLFNADGFDADCDPNAPPTFDMKSVTDSPSDASKSGKGPPPPSKGPKPSKPSS